MVDIERLHWGSGDGTQLSNGMGTEHGDGQGGGHRSGDGRGHGGNYHTAIYGEGRSRRPPETWKNIPDPGLAALAYP